jgi:hypothetical protein
MRHATRVRLLLQCMSQVLAQSGHTETGRYLSAFGAKADTTWRDRNGSLRQELAAGNRGR